MYLGWSVYIYKALSKFKVCWHGTHITPLSFYCHFTHLLPNIHTQTHTEILGMSIAHELWKHRHGDNALCACAFISTCTFAHTNAIKCDNINSLAVEFLPLLLSVFLFLSFVYIQSHTQSVWQAHLPRGDVTKCSLSWASGVFKH